MAQPTDLQTQMNTVQWTNGQRLITGSFIMGLFATIFAIFSGMGTWTGGVYAPNITRSAVTSAIGYTPAHEAGDTFGPGSVKLATASPALDTTYASASNVAPTNATAIVPGGIDLSVCTLFSCGAGFDHIRTGTLIANTTSDDGHSQEDGLTILGQIRTGFVKPYTASTAYSVGDNVAVSNGGYNGVYRATKTALTGTGGTAIFPSSRPAIGTTVTDSAQTWLWINDSAINAKVAGIYNECGAYAGAGSSWCNSFNFQLQPGHVPGYDTNTEFDIYNAAGNCNVGVANCYGIAVLGSGPYESSIGQLISGNATGNYTFHQALRVVGQNVASQQDIEDDGGAPVGFGFNITNYGTLTHSVATMSEGARVISPWFAIVNGAHASGGIIINPPAANSGATPAVPPTPIAYQCFGAITNSCVNDGSTAPISIALGGTHNDGLDFPGTFNNYLINAPNFHVLPSGAVQAVGYSETLTTPASSSATCTAGQFTDDANYHYVCVATNTWKRAALSAF